MTAELLFEAFVYLTVLTWVSLQVVFMFLVKFAVKRFDILAWPLLALVYPLWASIRAIEADDSSSSECRKLVAYWVLFSLIFLFEQAFHKLLLWLPFWLYMKLIITFWLVIHNFDGALSAYKHLVCPCLSVDIKSLLNKFNAWIDSSMEGVYFEDEVQRCVKENRPEALEGLVASELKCGEQNVVQKDVKTVQVTEQIKEVAASEEVRFVPNFLQEVTLTSPDFTQTENKKPETDLFSSENVEAVGESVLLGSLEIQLPKQVQKEWTCATCQVTTQSETTLNSHLQGKRHKTACEELKTKTQQSKTKALTFPEIKASLTETDKNNLAAEEIKEISGKVKGAGGISNKVQKEWTCSLCQVTTQSKQTHNSHLRGLRHKLACDELKAKNQQSESAEDAASILEQRRKNFKLQGLRKKYVEYKEPLWWCKICNISCSSSENMDCHMYGKKHLDQIKQVNAQAAVKSKAL